MTDNYLVSDKARNNFFRFAKLTFVLILLVIVAGSVVRMSGAGMGCPDWPKCFGKIIPPTSVDQLPENYKELYADRGYDSLDFNAFHTWTEYVNRLVGALAGLACFILLIFSIRYIKKDPWIFILSLLIFLTMAFQGWLGAVVVYSVLQPFKITIHMLMAMVIIAIVLHLLVREQKVLLVEFVRNDLQLKRILFLFLISVLVQVVLGTQLRESVDHMAETLGQAERENWLDKITWTKYLHRTFAWLPVGLAGYLLFINERKNYNYRSIYFIGVLIGIEFLAGLGLYFFGMPKILQPIHLVLSVLLFAQTYWLWLQLRNKARN